METPTLDSAALAGTTLILNEPPLTVDAQGTAVSTVVPTDGFEIVTIEPTNVEVGVSYRITYGGSFKSGELSKGANIPLPIVQTWNNANVKVENISPNATASFKTGIYGISSKFTKPLGASTTLSQYESASRQGGTQVQTLTFKNNTNDAVLLFYAVGAGQPQAIALNTDPSSLPPQWQGIPGFQATLNPTFQVTQNFFGQQIFVMNLSLIASNSITVLLQ